MPHRATSVIISKITEPHQLINMKQNIEKCIKFVQGGRECFIPSSI